MKKALIIFFVLSMTVMLADAQQDIVAKEILEKVSEKTRAYKSINAVFEFVMENPDENISEVNTGTIILKGNKYKVTMNEMGLEIYCNGIYIWTYLKNANEVSISEFDENSEDLMNPSKIFTIYEKGFAYRYVGETVENEISLYTIDLFPDNSDTEIEKISLIIDKQKMTVKNAYMKGKDGNNYNISVKDFKTDLPVNNTDFEFNTDQYEDLLINDMR